MASNKGNKLSVLNLSSGRLMDMVILVADDDLNVQEILKLYLEKDGYSVVLANDGEEALRQFASQRFDLVVLDIMMPKKDGWEVCREIRRTSKTPIIMLSAKGEDYDRILGLELGADDYVVKPFNPGEVVARVKAVLRRTQNGEKDDEAGIISIGNLVVNLPRREVTLRGEPVVLTPKEFDLLYFLVSHPGRAFDREQLLDQVWGYQFLGDSRTVDAHVKRLRKKLDNEGEKWSISTVWGFGYKFIVD